MREASAADWGDRAVPAAPLGLPARQCHELTPTLRPLLRSSSALVMLPSLLASMYARDTASAQRLSYCRYGFVLRKREALLRCRPIDRKRRRRKSCAADYYRSGQSYLAHVQLSL